MSSSSGSTSKRKRRTFWFPKRQQSAICSLILCERGPHFPLNNVLTPRAWNLPESARLTGCLPSRASSLISNSSVPVPLLRVIISLLRCAHSCPLCGEHFVLVVGRGTPYILKLRISGARQMCSSRHTMGGRPPVAILMRGGLVKRQRLEQQTIYLFGSH